MMASQVLHSAARDGMSPWGKVIPRLAQLSHAGPLTVLA